MTSRDPSGDERRNLYTLYEFNYVLYVCAFDA